MSLYRQLIVILGAVALLLFTFGTAAAKPKDTPKPPHGDTAQPRVGNGKPARLTWTPSHIKQDVTAGQTVQLTATFTSSVDIADATLVVSGGLGKVLKVDSATLSNIKAGTLTTVTFTVTMPTKAHTQGGVIQVRTGKRMLGRPLSVLLIVANGSDTGPDTGDAPKPSKPTHP